MCDGVVDKMSEELRGGESERLVGTLVGEAEGEDNLRGEERRGWGEIIQKGMRVVLVS